MLAMLLLLTVWHRGKASVYSNHFEGRRMANGVRYHARNKVVASRDLPLGSRIVLCVRTRCAEAEVSDRGPFVRGRTFDISPAVARALGVEPDGVITLSYKVVR